jgi:SAM-dependent methyltransferase
MSSESPADGTRISSPSTSGPDGDEYAAILRASLGPDLQHFVEFFSDARRVRVMAEMLRQHFDRTPGWVLNVGCGPFATECFVPSLRPHRIVSFDYTTGFAPAYPALRARGYLSNTHFLIGNALALEFRRSAFDLIIIHDVLYEPALELGALLRKYGAFLRPGGLIFLTVLDARTRWLWKCLGQEKALKRYEIPNVLRLLHDLGYHVLDCVPSSLEARGRLNQAFKQLLWRSFGMANHYAILARSGVR